MIGPIAMIFGMKVGLMNEGGIFYESRSKVKVENRQKNALSGPVLGTDVRYGSYQNQVWSGWVLLAACQLI